MMKQIWKQVVGYEGRYEVSDDGVVRSVARVACNGRSVPAKLLTPCTNNPGFYPRVTLFVDGQRRKLKVADLVAAAFIGPKPSGSETCHNDGNPSNSHWRNLRYDTPKGNQADRKKHGTDRHRSHVLTARQVEEIKSSSLSGLALARKFGVSQGAVSHIRTGRNWGHVKCLTL